MDYKNGSINIKNCKVQYECPLTWDKLKETARPDIRFCDKCKQEVVHITNRDDFEKCTSRCVYLKVDIEEIGGDNYNSRELMGEICFD